MLILIFKRQLMRLIKTNVTQWGQSCYSDPFRRSLGTLSLEELDLLKETTDTLIEHMERIKARSGAARH